ncbi:polysaccharide biosynthesis protein [bacterium]|nr:polysaccharide biosynthesis protein [bacterium]
MKSKDTIRVVIVGAGKAGELLSAEILKDKESTYEIIGFVDDKVSGSVNKLNILGNISSLRNIVESNAVEEIIIAIPSERGKVIRSIIESTAGLKLVYKILPRLSEVLLQDFKKQYLKFVRRVKPEDLLGGEILKSDQQEITDFSKKQVVLITGAAGSIGSELSRQIAAHNAKKIVFYDWWENGMFDLQNQLHDLYPDLNYEFIIGDVKDRRKIDQVVKTYLPTTIFHAAAYKHVPLMEHNPAEAIKNNIIGTKTVAEIAIKYKVNKFILVSTDKAVNPTNIMGATKRAAEKMIHILASSQDTTSFCAVRFGNVINSNGSAIPTFKKQIMQGGPVTVTHRQITRYFMTIPEAVHLILQTWVMGKNNDLFVLDMGEPVKIYELAKLLIALQGYVPDEEIKIKITGLRPGEKLYEEVLVKEEEVQATSVKKIFRTTNYMNFDRLAFLNNLSLLIESVDTDSLDTEYLRNMLRQMISTYKPSKEQI